LQVLSILKHRGIVQDFKLINIDNKSEQEVAHIMQESLFFFSFSHEEGFGLPPLEAMACGCITVGYHGYGGQEYFLPDISYPVDQGDVVNYVKTAERAIQLYKENSELMSEKCKRASEFVIKKYNLEISETNIVKIWKNEIKNLIIENESKKCVE